MMQRGDGTSGLSTTSAMPLLEFEQLPAAGVWLSAGISPGGSPALAVVVVALGATVVVVTKTGAAVVVVVAAATSGLSSLPQAASVSSVKATRSRFIRP